MSTTPYDQGIEDLMELYHRQREEAVETRRRINEVTATATAPRQTVEVTVTAQGEVTAIDFPTGAFRRMAPKELSELLLATIRQARAEALQQVAELTSLGLPPGVSVSDLLQGKADPTVLLSEDPTMPDSVRDYLAAGGPRDEPPQRPADRNGGLTMANEPFSVDTDGLHLQLPYVQQLAARFKGIASGLEGRLSDLGACWGDDATGEEFFKQYDSPHQEIHKGIGGIGQVVHSTAEGIHTMAVNFQRLEDTNIETVRRINTGAGEHRPAPERPMHG